MKRSLKLYLFWQLLLTTIVIILANRLIAQYFVFDSFKQDIHIQMGRGLVSCQTRLQGQEEFVRCFNAAYKGNISNSLVDFYLLCDKPLTGQVADTLHRCQQLRNKTLFWYQDGSSRELEYAKTDLGGMGWVAVRFSDRAQGPQIWLSQNHIDDFRAQLWSMRDRLLIFTLPTILLLLFLMAVYMTYLIMRPLTQLENTLSRLSLPNLDQSTQLIAPFKEFNRVTEVFEDLRLRLNQSFTKARRFASDASHELRTPLTILRGNVERFITELPTGSASQVRMRTIGDEIERLIEITNKLLLLSRADANDLSRDLRGFNLSDLLSKSLQDTALFEPGPLVESLIEPGIWMYGDITLTMQLFHNLYANALNYSTEDGWIKVSLSRAHGNLELVVENSAKDIPADLCERAFDRFYRGDAAHSRNLDGLGLGLSICLAIAHLSKGELTLSVSKQKSVHVKFSAPLFLSGTDLSDSSLQHRS
jgi:signal transduction histidine kinase